MNEWKSVFLFVSLGVSILLLFALLFFGSQFLEQVQQEALSESGVPPVDLPVSHQYVDGLHTYTGVITAPTPCHQLFSEVDVDESFPEQVILYFDTVSEAEVCAHVSTPQTFHVSFRASNEAVVNAWVNGIPANLVVTNIPPDEPLPETRDEGGEE